VVDVRDARFVSLTADGQGLVLEHEGRHLRLPLDARVRAALAGEVQMPMPLETRITPREIQHRLRCGESASAIAAAAGVGVELIARFEGPVVAERDWHIAEAQKTEIGEVPLRERVAGVVARAGDDPLAVEWAAWLTDDNGWRVQVSLPDGRVAAWAWDPRTHRLRARDDLARIITSGDAADDDLDAVLRPVATAREADRAAATVVTLRPVEPAAEHAGDGESAAAVDAEPPSQDGTGRDVVTVVTDDSEVERPADQPADPTDAGDEAEVPAAAVGGKKRRASVPSWDEILMGSTKRRDDS
jgi:hypothetical protein